MYDEEIEKAMLYYIIYENYKCEINEEDFINSRNKKIAKAINELKAENKEIGILNIQTKIKANKKEVLEYLTELGQYIYNTTQEDIYRQLIELSNKRKIFKILQNSLCEINESDSSIVIQNLIKNITNIDKRQAEDEENFINKLAMAMKDLEDKYNNKSDYSLYTGLYDLDGMTCGLHNEELTIIGARPRCWENNISITNSTKYCTKK